jgi:transposase
MTKQQDDQPEVQPTEVKPKRGSRRTYPIFYKRRILTLVDQCTKPGEVGKLLRREGLYSSHLTDWRRQQVEGMFDLAEPPSRGPKPKILDERDQRIAKLEMDNALLERKVHKETLRAQKAEAQVEFQKKISCLLGADITELRDDVC